MVEVFDRNHSRTWRLAYIDSKAPYRGREGYYVAWLKPADGDTWKQWHSRGGWVSGRDVRKTDTCDVRDCGCWREPGMRVCQSHLVGMAALEKLLL